MAKQNDKTPRNADLTCANPDCDKPVLAKGYCRTHYRRIQRGGNPDDTNLREKRVIEVSVARFRPEVAGLMFVEADKRGISPYEMLQVVAEEWYQRTKKGTSAPSKRNPPDESSRLSKLA